MSNYYDGPEQVCDVCQKPFGGDAIRYDESDMCEACYCIALMPDAEYQAFMEIAAL